MNVLNTPSPSGRIIRQVPGSANTSQSPAQYTISQNLTPSTPNQSYSSPKTSSIKTSSPSPSPNITRVRISPEEARRAESARVGRRLQGSLAVVLIWCIAKTFNLSLTLVLPLLSLEKFLFHKESVFILIQKCSLFWKI